MVGGNCSHCNHIVTFCFSWLIFYFFVFFLISIYFFVSDAILGVYQPIAILADSSDDLDQFANYVAAAAPAAVREDDILRAIIFFLLNQSLTSAFFCLSLLLCVFRRPK